jgi:hypothetical protein
LKSNQPDLLREAQQWLGNKTDADATSEDIERGHPVIRRLYLGQATTGPDGWEHIRTVLRVVRASDRIEPPAARRRGGAALRPWN